jgi:hypothetical protein
MSAGTQKFVVALVIAVTALLTQSVNPVFGQEYSMSVSSYSDVWGDTSTVESQIAFYDQSWGCSHWGYQIEAALSGPGGTDYYYAAGTAATGMSVPAMTGDYSHWGYLSVNCSCAGFVGIGGYSQNFKAKITNSFYQNPTQGPGACWYSQMACSGGTPTCTGGITVSLQGSFCSYYAWADWLAITFNNGLSYSCLFGVSGNAPSAGQCN